VEIWSKYAALDEAGDPYRGHAGMRDWREEIYRNFDLHEVFADDVRDFGRPAREPPSCQEALPPSGLLQVRPVGTGEPIRIQTRVDRFLSSPQRIDVGTIGGEAGGHLRTLGNGAVAGDHDIDMPDRLPQPVECCLVGAHLIVLAKVEERDQDVGEHVAGEQDPTVREEDRGVADGVCLMLDDLARHRPAVRGQWVTSPTRSTGMSDALSAAIFCARSRASPATWAQAAVA
jgi:hypothetical protein